LVKENKARRLTEEGAGELPLGFTVALVLSLCKFQLYFVEGVVGTYKTTAYEVHSGNVGAPCFLYAPAQPAKVLRDKVSDVVANVRVVVPRVPGKKSGLSVNAIGTMLKGQDVTVSFDSKTKDIMNALRAEGGTASSKQVRRARQAHQRDTGQAGDDATQFQVMQAFLDKVMFLFSKY
jgi:hypothetical protein